MPLKGRALEMSFDDLEIDPLILSQFKKEGINSEEVALFK